MEWNLVTNIGVNAPILLVNGKVAITHFESETRQLFETDEGSFIYFKDEQKLHKITENLYTKALIKVITCVDYKIEEENNKALL
jgi:hypothetical protein